MTYTTGDAFGASFGLGGDLPVQRLGYGAMRITGPGIWGEPRDHDEAVAVLRRAVDQGVNLIDTADSYGPFVSERLIATGPLSAAPKHSSTVANRRASPSSRGRRWTKVAPPRTGRSTRSRRPMRQRRGKSRSPGCSHDHR